MTYLFPPEYIQNMKPCLYSTLISPPRDIQYIIERDLHQKIDELFESFDMEPIASASLGQVSLFMALHDCLGPSSNSENRRRGRSQDPTSVCFMTVAQLAVVGCLKQLHLICGLLRQLSKYGERYKYDSLDHLCGLSQDQLQLVCRGNESKSAC